VTDDHNPTYADGCPSCLRRDVQPTSGIPDGADGLVAAYRCPDCRHSWTCSWGIVPGRVLPPVPREQNFIDRHASAQLHEQAAINRARKLLGRRQPPHAA
jgi:transposase-like protein